MNKYLAGFEIQELSQKCGGVIVDYISHELKWKNKKIFKEKIKEVKNNYKFYILGGNSENSGDLLNLLAVLTDITRDIKNNEFIYLLNLEVDYFKETREEKYYAEYRKISKYLFDILYDYNIIFDNWVKNESRKHLDGKLFHHAYFVEVFPCILFVFSQIIPKNLFSRFGEFKFPKLNESHKFDLSYIYYILRNFCAPNKLKNFIFKKFQKIIKKRIASGEIPENPEYISINSGDGKDKILNLFNKIKEELSRRLNKDLVLYSSENSDFEFFYATFLIESNYQVIHSPVERENIRWNREYLKMNKQHFGLLCDKNAKIGVIVRIHEILDKYYITFTPIISGFLSDESFFIKVISDQKIPDDLVEKNKTPELSFLRNEFCIGAHDCSRVEAWIHGYDPMRPSAGSCLNFSRTYGFIPLSELYKTRFDYICNFAEMAYYHSLINHKQIENVLNLIENEDSKPIKLAKFIYEKYAQNLIIENNKIKQGGIYVNLEFNPKINYQGTDTYNAQKNIILRWSCLNDMAFEFDPRLLKDKENKNKYKRFVENIRLIQILINTPYIIGEDVNLAVKKIITSENPKIDENKFEKSINKYAKLILK